MKERISTKKSIKLIALLLTISTVIVSLPLTVFAYQNETTMSNVQEPTMLEPEDVPDQLDYEELVEQGYIERLFDEENDLYSYLFGNEDGTKTRIYYQYPVKYIDEKGNIKDKSLKLVSKFVNGIERFVSTDNDISVTFHNSIESGIELAYKELSLSMVPEVTGLALRPMFAELSDDDKRVRYSVDDNTYIEYSLTYTGIKEDIVVAQYTGCTSYSFFVSTGGLAITQDEYGQYVLVDSEGNVQADFGDVLIFTADERNNTFGSMRVETIKEDYLYRLVIELDAEWLADKQTVYPITIDPTISITANNTTSGSIEDCVIGTSTTYSGTSGSLYVGRGSSGAIIRSVMRFPSLNLTGKIISSASVEIRDLMCETESIQIECHEYIGNSWSEANAPSWSSVGSNSVGKLLDSKFVCYGNGNVPNEIQRYSFDITSLAKHWAAGTSDPAKGVIFKAVDAFESGTVKTFKTFASINRAETPPSLSVTYSDPIGLNPSFEYNTQTLGDNVTIHNNIQFGGLVVEVALDVPESLFPIKPAYIYNSVLSNEEFVTHYGLNNALSMQFLPGWKTNLTEVIIKQGAGYYYVDGYNTEYYFTYDSVKDQYVLDEIGAFLIVESNGDVTLNLDDGSTRKFDQKGRLIWLKYDEKEYTYVYSNNKLSQIKCDEETIFTFNYDNNSIRDLSYMVDGTTISCGRASASSPSVRDQYGNTMYITVSQTLFEIYSGLDGYGYRYTLSNGTVTGYTYFRKVGNTPYSISTTEINRDGNRITYTSNGLMTTYLLNTYNQLYNVIVSSTDGKTVYDAQMYSYKKAEEQEASYAKGSAQNLLSSTYSAFSTSWNGNYSTSSSKALMGSKSVLLTSSDGSKKSIWQSISLTAGKYVISAYVQYSDLQKVNSQLAGGFYMNVLNSSNAIVCNGEYYLDSLTEAEDEWVRVWIPCTIGSNGTYKITFALENAIGTVYLDCFQVEKGDIPSTYNCVKNAGFESSGSWTQNYTQVASNSMFDNYVAQGGKNSFQSINLDNMPNTRKFIISGWLYCTGAEAGNYALLLRLQNSSSYLFRLPFEDVEGLQYISYEITIPSSYSTLGGMELVLSGTASSSATVAYFDNILFTFGGLIKETDTETHYSTGLNFGSYGDGFCYLRSIGSCTDTAIVVPPTSPNGETVIKVGSSAFAGNTQITSITFPDTLEIIRFSAFENCISLKSVNFGNSLTELEYDAFKGCSALEEITLPDTLEVIGSSCFEGCTTLQSIVIPDSVITLLGACFYGCSSLENVTLSESLTLIDYSTFSGCRALKSIVIPSKVTQINLYAFENCTSLQSVQLPKSLTTVQKSVFDNVADNITFYCNFEPTHWSGITFGSGALPTTYRTEFNSELMGNFVYIYTYDGNDIVGTTIKYIGYDKEEIDNKIVMFTSVTYDARGNLLSYTDESGHTTTYTYDIYGNVLTVTDASGVTTTYIYYSNGLLKSVSRGGQTNTYTYTSTYTYTNGLLTGVTRTGPNYSQSYTYTYNNYGNLVSVKVGSQTLVTYAYEDGGKGDLLSITYANGDVKSYTYDIFGNITAVRMNNTLQASYLYDYSGSLYAHTETVTGETTRYFEDEYGYAGFSLTFGSNGKQVAAIAEPSVEISIETKVDAFDRVYKDILKVGNTEISKIYEYIDNDYYSSYEIESEQFSGGSTFAYTYNNLGYLTSVEENDIIELRYTYDILGQLVREDNPYSGKTYVYTYDGGGNILTKETYTYTTEEDPGTVESTVNYGYGNSNWKDQLTSYNGTAITYDASGNPLNWRNASTINWTGRQLDSMTLTNGTALSFLYNSDGLRVSKTVGGETVKYRWDGTTLLAEEHDDYTITFLYDGDTLIGFNYGGNNYYYGIDNLGVIHYVYDESGEVVVIYTYDAWGNTISAFAREDSTIINVNPIRYKSYYFDSETGLFYLQSRYYDPIVGRFVNADVMQDTASVLGFNLSAYCENNPIMYVDPTGYGRTYVIYYNNPGTGFYDQAMNSPYYNRKSKSVYMISVTSNQDFIDAWNSMSGTIDYVYLYLHGGKGVLYFLGESLNFSGKQSFSSLKSKRVKKGVYLFSCKGGAGSEGNNVAWMFAKLTSSKVYACTGSVSYSKIFGKYYANKSWDWGIIKTFYYQKRYIFWGANIAKSVAGQW